MKRFAFASLAVAGAMLAACSSNTTTPTPTDSSVTDTGTTPPVDAADTGVVPTDRPSTDGGDASDGGAGCRGLPIINLNTAGMQTGNVTRYTGSNESAPAVVPSALRPPTDCAPVVGGVVMQYTTRAAGALRISTTNDGTARSFDTVLWVLNGCGTTPRTNFCNDDDPDYATAADRRVSSLITTGVLEAGTTVTIMLAGYDQAGGSMITTPRGAFVLTVTELVPAAMGAACDVAGRTTRCGNNLACVGTTPLAEMGTCQALGTVPGSPCRSSAPECDSGLACERVGTVGFCTRQVAMGAECDTRVNPAFRTCASGFTCVNETLGGTVGTCRATGSVAGYACRPTGAAGGRCDAPLVCDEDATTPLCRTAATTDMPCNTLRSLCPAGNTCVPSGTDSSSGTCRANGTVRGTRCRAAGATARCDGTLRCEDFGASGTPLEYCVEIVPTAGRCSNDSFQICDSRQPCFFTDYSDTSHGRCGAEGGSGGACRITGTACETSLTCSNEAPTADNTGVCRTVATAGSPCQAPTIGCGDGLTCVINDTLSPTSTNTMGTCRANGSAAGTACVGGATACMAGLTCNGSVLAGGVCQTTVAAGAACDPLNGTTACPTGQVCVPAAFNRGTCAAAAGAETEPNNSPATAGTAITAARTITARLDRGDVDCVSVTVAAMGGLLATVSDGNGVCPARGGGGLVLDVYAPDGVSVIGSSQDHGPGQCGAIDGNRRGIFDWASGLAAGNYTVCVRGFVSSTGTGTATTNYVLTAAPLPPRS